MLLDDIVALLREVSRNAHVVDNEKIDDRIWQDFIMLKRNTWIKNHLNDTGVIEQNALQFELLDTEIYDPALVLGGISINNKIIRTELCPTIIEGRGGVAVYELSTPDMIGKTIANVSMDRLRWCGEGVTNKDAIYAAFYDGRFYLKSKSGIEKPLSKLRIVAIFADPTQVSTYVRATDDYPVNDYMVQYMKNAVLTEDFKMLSETNSDNQNNASGEIAVK